MFLISKSALFKIKFTRANVRRTKILYNNFLTLTKFAVAKFLIIRNYKSVVTLIGYYNSQLCLQCRVLNKGITNRKKNFCRSHL